jgi:hypothetical protein
MDHIIAEGERIFGNTRHKNTWMIYHDHLKIWWEKDSQDYLKSLPCSIDGNPYRTWYDWQIKICGRANNDKVHNRYKNCLPGDSPELMPLDNHLFADLQEGAAKNVALTYHIKEKKMPKNNEVPDPNPDPDADIKYSFSTPSKVFDSLQCTIKSGCPSRSWIVEDVFRVFDETIQRIIDAKGTYIEDSSMKIARHGVRGEAQARHKKREVLPVDPVALDGFNHMLAKMEKGDGVGFIYDLTGSDAATQEEDGENELHTVQIIDCDGDDGGDGVLKSNTYFNYV